jgi:uncharacterized SAM-binding protein YcdF (DUF218 family)
VGFVLETDSGILNYTLVLVSLFFLFVFSFGLYALIAFLLLNARVVLRRERRSLQNSLTLIAALGLSVVAIFYFFEDRLPIWFHSLWIGALFVLVFCTFHITVFFVSCFLCVLSHPQLNQQYIIVLGSGLAGGRVTPLLSARIDRAIAFYHRQAAKHRPPPKLVFSGGNVSDESISEAAAMRLYALEKNIPETDILLEDKARNTYENFAFSKAIMEKDSGGSSYRCIFSTSGYHLLRAGAIARSVGLRITGISAKTALYYRPNALLREYIAFVSLRKKQYAVFAVLLFVLGTLTGFYLK